MSPGCRTAAYGCTVAHGPNGKSTISRWQCRSSPEELHFKRNSILKHQSQMENAPFLGDDDRLFWQRAEDRNRATARLYFDLGLASYEAIEAFVQYHPIR